MHYMNGQLLKGRYRLIRKLGSGGFGEVWEAMDVQLERIVAIKWLHAAAASSQHKARFRREAKIMARLSDPGTPTHRNVVTIYDSFEQGEIHYLVMEYCSGGSLEDKLSQGVELSIPYVVAVAQSLAAILQKAHQEKIVHRDIKPANILLQHSGETQIVKLNDFGIAHVTQAAPGITATGERLGTQMYWAPEQAKGLKVTEKTDIYALGVVLYRLLSRRHYLPYKQGAELDNLRAIIQDTPTPLFNLRSDVPRWLNDLVMQMLEKDPARRPSAREIEQQLLAQSHPAQAQGRMAGSGGIEPPLVRLPTPSPYTHWIATLVTVIVLSVVLTLAYLNYSESPGEIIPEEGIVGAIQSDDGPVNLRREPDTESEVLTQLVNESAVQVRGRDADNEWFWVQTATETGWVTQSYVTVPVRNTESFPVISPDMAALTPEPETTTAWVGDTSPADGLRLRSDPDTNGAILTVLPPGQVLEIIRLDESQTWAYIRVEGEPGEGWVHAGYLVDGDGLPLTLAPATTSE